jgi:hypothetical protein
MNKSRPSRLRFNFGFLLEAPIGTFREVELDYPSAQVAHPCSSTSTNYFIIRHTQRRKALM